MADNDTRTRILNAAGAVFAERGFRDATVREIAGRAGANLASVNYHFGDKDRLYVEAVRHAHEIYVRLVPLPDWPPGTPPERRLRDFIRTMTTRMLGARGAPWQAQLMVREILQPTAACRELIEDYLRPNLQILLGILGELLPPETPPHRRQQFAFSVVGQGLFYRFSSQMIGMMIPAEELATHFRAEDIAEHVSNVMLAALGREPLRVA